MKKGLILFAALGMMMTFSCKESTNSTTSQDANDTIAKTDTKPEKEVLGNPIDVKADPGTFQIKPLKYGYDEVNEYIDGKTMETHFSKHYLGYTNKLNAALKDAGIKSNNIVEILKNMDMNNAALRNNAGGYYNHQMYFDLISPNPATAPTGDLLAKITTDFGSVDELVNQLKDAGSKQFGSGWSWLVLLPDGNLAVTATPNQDNPLMPGAKVAGIPILGIDVWEHAYYLKYMNKRDDYLTNFFKVLDWKQVETNYANALKG